VPFISKATGVPLAKVATRVMMGEKLSDLRASGVVPEESVQLNYSAVKEAVLPWSRFPGEDTLLGPEMRATGEVMGIASTTALAFAKALSGAGQTIPTEGAAFISLADRDKAAGVTFARQLVDLGFALFATHGTAGHLARNGIASTHVDKVGDGPYDPVRLIEERQIDLVINTPAGGKARGDGRIIRRAATRHGIPCVTTAAGGLALVSSIAAIRDKDIDVTSLQDHHISAGV
jgi:carbamoyl-phosphate synthase large subunit